jgi:pimeloyl-ACP methyl ester carboxylesterase
MGSNSSSTPDRGDLTARYATRLERIVVSECGHWMQQERPDEVNALLVPWLAGSVR